MNNLLAPHAGARAGAGASRLAPSRRIAPAFAALAAALVFAAPAAAKQTMITVDPPAGHPVAGVPWQVTFHVEFDGKPYVNAGYHPKVYVTNPSSLAFATFAATRVGPGMFRARLVFPHAGRWRYTIDDPIMGDWYFDAKVAANSS